MSEIDTEELEAEKKQQDILRNLPPRQAALAALVNNGLTIKEAANQLRYKYNSAKQILHDKKLTKLLFKHDYKAQKVANRTLKAFAAGKIPEDSDIQNVKDSTALQAACYLHDRIEPVQKEADGSVVATQNYTQINVNFEFLNSLQVRPIEADNVIEIEAEAQEEKTK